MQCCRIQELCFNCDEKFITGHQCRKPQILLLDGGDEENEEITAKDPKISLHTLFGWSFAQSLKITTSIYNQGVVVLVDSKSTHNFISDRLASLLQLSMVPTEPFWVKVASGHLMNYREWFKSDPVEI